MLAPGKCPDAHRRRDPSPGLFAREARRAWVATIEPMSRHLPHDRPPPNARYNRPAHETRHVTPPCPPK
jgi:hypothetical protein